jgi:hypothetical protein
MAQVYDILEAAPEELDDACAFVFHNPVTLAGWFEVALRSDPQRRLFFASNTQ